MTLNDLIDRMAGQTYEQAQPLDPFHKTLADHMAAGNYAEVDILINACDRDSGECRICSQIVCPYGESFHFHHDGCPACCQHDCGTAITTAAQAATDKSED